MTLKERFKKRPFSYLTAIVACVLALFMVSMMLPGDMSPGGAKVEAAFTASLYNDCYIDRITLLGGADTDDVQQLVSWTSSNPSQVPSFATNTYINAVSVNVYVNPTRLASGGNIYDHMNVTVKITDPASNVQYYYDAVPSPLPGSTSYWTYYIIEGAQPNYLNYLLDTEGMYSIQVTYSIQIP